MRRLVADIAGPVDGRAAPAGISLLDYGCGKGSFIAEMRGLNLFTELAGYDPAVREFQARPAKAYDVVTCLDVLDVVEPHYLDAVLEDVAQFTGGIAVFDCLCRPKTNLQPHPPFYWNQLVARRFRVARMSIEFPGMHDFERAVIFAIPPGQDSVTKSSLSSPSQGS